MNDFSPVNQDRDENDDENDTVILNQEDDSGAGEEDLNFDDEENNDFTLPDDENDTVILNQENDSGAGEEDLNFDDEENNDFTLPDDGSLASDKLKLLKIIRKYRLPRKAVDAILKWLQGINIENIPNFPISGLSITSVPQTFNYVIQDKCGGDYVYLGIAKNLRSPAGPLFLGSITNDIIDLTWNTDGVDLAVSLSFVCWPIFGLCSKSRQPFLIAVYVGESKPNDYKEIFERFCQRRCVLGK